MKKTISLERKNIYRGALILVNADHPLREVDERGLVSVDMRFPDILINRWAANVLQLILWKISAGSSIVPVSGYRSLEEQKTIYADSLRDNGEAFTQKYVALPDHSEHQTGLAIDLGLDKENIDFIRPYFPCEGICDDFRKAAPDYGFIQRYEKGKEKITGISYEPWHFRYVGYPHSKIMAENGFCLEEYIIFLKGCQENRRLIWRQEDRIETEVFYVPASEERMEIQLPENCVHQVSGNNEDGFIITAWRGIS